MTDDFESLATAISDHYELQRKVGAGGMAISYLARVIAKALRGHAALARGDSLEAIRLVLALKPTARPDSIPWHKVQPLGMERLLLPQLHLARGEYGQALDVARLLDSPAPVYYLIQFRSSLHVRKAAAERLGDARLASHFERRLAALEALP